GFQTREQVVWKQRPSADRTEPSSGSRCAKALRPDRPGARRAAWFFSGRTHSAGDGRFAARSPARPVHCALCRGCTPGLASRTRGNSSDTGGPFAGAEWIAVRIILVPSGRAGDGRPVPLGRTPERTGRRLLRRGCPGASVDL